MTRIDCGIITSHAGKSISVSVEDHTYAPRLYVAAVGILDGSSQLVSSVNDMRAPGFSHTPVAKQVLARGATHAVVLGHGKTAIIIAVDEATAGRLTEIQAEASRRAVASEAGRTQSGWEAAERACPAGYVPATVEWTNSDLCARGVVTRDGIKATISDTAKLHAGYVWMPVQEIEAKRAGLQAKIEAADAAAVDLAAVVVPAQAIADYRRYAGSAEQAWAAEDEGAWSLIRRYSAAIEAQGLVCGLIQVAMPPAAPEDSADHAGG